jgi:hypothetical protein
VNFGDNINTVEWQTDHWHSIQLHLFPLYISVIINIQKGIFSMKVPYFFAFLKTIKTVIWKVNAVCKFTENFGKLL